MTDLVVDHPPFFFTRAGRLFEPGDLARSPWHRGAIAGGPISGLLATAAEDPVLDADFEIARFSMDILGKVPFAPAAVLVHPLRDGRQMKLHRVTIDVEGRSVAQAHILRVRRADTPSFEVAHDYPSPSVVKHPDHEVHPRMGGGIMHRPVLGKPGVPGRSVGWVSISGEIVAGQAASPFVKAALLADFGSGFGNATLASEWSYANLDITLQFLRMPRGDWLLIDADTHTAGVGHGTAGSSFADESGIFARGFQTIFVARGRYAIGPSGRPEIPKSGLDSGS